MSVILSKIKTIFRQFLTHNYFYKKIHVYRVNKYTRIAKEKFDRRNSYFQNEAKELLALFSKLMHENQITFWIDFGTLLGYYRNQDFIPHDLDIDTGAFIEDADKIRNVLLNNGFTLAREFSVNEQPGKEDCFVYKHTSIDVFYYIKTDKECYGYTFDSLRPFKKIYLNRKRPMKVAKIVNPYKGITSTEFQGSHVNIPINTKEWLIWNYGETFMTPDSKFDHHNSANYTEYSVETLSGTGIIHIIL